MPKHSPIATLIARILVMRSRRGASLRSISIRTAVPALCRSGAGSSALPEEIAPSRGRFSGKMRTVADDILELQRAFGDGELRADADRLGDLLADDLSIGKQF